MDGYLVKLKEFNIPRTKNNNIKLEIFDKIADDGIYLAKLR